MTHTRSRQEYTYPQIYLFGSLFVSPSLIAINFIRVNPTGSVLSTLPLTPDEELQNNLLETKTFVELMCGTRMSRMPLRSIVTKSFVIIFKLKNMAIPKFRRLLPRKTR